MPIDPISAWTATKATVGAVKKALDVNSEWKKTPLKQQIIDLTNLVTEQADDLLAARQRIAELEAKLSQRDEFEQRDGNLWKKSGEGPFCLKCQMVHGRTVALVKREQTIARQHHVYLECPLCDISASIG